MIMETPRFEINLVVDNNDNEENNNSNNHNNNNNNNNTTIRNGNHSNSKAIQYYNTSSSNYANKKTSSSANATKVYNLNNKSKKIFLNPSYLRTDQLSRAEGSIRQSFSSKKKIKKTTVFTMGNSNKEDENTYCPNRTQTSRIWNRIKDKGTKTIRSGKSMMIDSNNKIVKITPEKDSPSSEPETDSETCDLNEHDVQDIIKDVLKNQLRSTPYDHEKCKSQSAEISLEIHDRLKALCHGAYKIAVNIFIGEVRGDGIETSTQSMWNPHSDCVVSGFYKNSSTIAIATVFASYAL